MIEKLIIRIAKALDKGNIPYMIVGGQAVLLYGEPRMTKDIDITLGIGIKNLAKIINIIEKIGLKPIPPNFETFVKETYVLPIKDKFDSRRIDFIFSYARGATSTPYERQAIKRANKVKIRDTFVKFASIEDTIIHKVFAGRPRDLEDVKSILLRNPDIDSKYIKKWLKVFGIKFINTFSKMWKKIIGI